MKKCLLIIASLYTAIVSGQQPPASLTTMVKTADSLKTAPAKKSSIADKTKGNKKYDGLFTLYQDTITGSIQLYVKKEQLGKDFIYQSFSINGPVALFLNQNMIRQTAVFKIQKAFDKLEFSIVNTDFYYDKNNPISKTADVDKAEAVFYADKFSTEDSLGYLVNADALFISEKLDPVKPIAIPSPTAFLNFNLGILNPLKSKYAGIRSFPNNTDVVVDLSYDNPNALAGSADVTDPRYVRVRMQHSFIEMPKNDFKPRRDDPRIGYFMEQVTNQTSISAVPYKDMIHRWNLKKKDPSAALSEPVEPIVWWIENTTPEEYRSTIMAAGLKWNEAFAQAGFKNAVQMKMMSDTATWDPADIRYNVIRWVASAQPSYGAIGPSFVNPRTGQILGADITVEWFSGSATPIYEDLVSFSGEQNNQLPHLGTNKVYDKCTIGQSLKNQYITGLTAMEAGVASDADIKEMHKQFLTYLILHEMGHTMGLNHNMKASQMLSPSQINDTSITHKIGLIGSVMDYPAINIALDRTKQGDYYTTKSGPYDGWAIEYGYKEFSENDEEAGLKKILFRSTESQLAFGNDGDDMRAPGKAMDPRVNVNDLTNDAIGYAEDRFKLVNNLMSKLVLKYSKDNQSFAELRARYGLLNGQRSTMINAVSRYIGGVYIDRSFPEQKSITKPYTPVPLSVQKKAIDVLNKYVFAPNAYDADTQVFPYLQIQRRGFNQPNNGEDFKISNMILSNQINGAIAHILHPATLQRLTNSRLYGNQYSTTDVIADLNKGIFDADITNNVNVYRQYLQTAYVKALATIADEKSTYDEVAKAAARYNLKKLKTKLSAAAASNEETKAHRANLVFIIDKATTVK